MRRLLSLDWDAIAGILAAGAAIVMHFLHLIDQGVLLMFKPQSLFDALLRPAVENPMVRSIQFVLDRSQKPLWESEVLPKLQECRGCRKVRPTAWTDIDENVSFILAETAPGQETEALLSFWGEPFMSRSTGGDIPRYIFHVQGRSELVARLVEVERRYRLGS